MIDELKGVMMDRAKSGSQAPQWSSPGKPAGPMQQKSPLSAGIAGAMAGMGQAVGRAPSGVIPDPAFKLPPNLPQSKPMMTEPMSGQPNASSDGIPIDMPNKMNLPPPTSPAKVDPRWERWETANKMIDGYQNNWQPNPVLLSLLGK